MSELKENKKTNYGAMNENEDYVLWRSKVPLVDDVALSNARLRYKKINAGPLCLISQMQRSGGSLLIQLLDGHRQLLVHPSELHIGRPGKYEWIDFEYGQSPQEIFFRMFEHPLFKFATKGYNKSVVASPTLPFTYFPSLHRKIFEAYFERAVTSEENFVDDVIRHYHRTLFSTWIDYNMGQTSKHPRFVVSHIARFIAGKQPVKSFFADIPKARMISVIRDPLTWYASAKAYSDEYADAAKALELWDACLEGATYLRKAKPNKFLAVKFSDLLTDPSNVLARVTEFLNVEETIDVQPTFNKMSIFSNSSFKATEGQISQGPLDNYAGLSTAEIELIKGWPMAKYEEFWSEFTS